MEQTNRGTAHKFITLPPWLAVFISYLLCVATVAAGFAHHYTLDPITGSWITLVSITSLIIGSIGFVVLVAPWHLALVLLARWWKGIGKLLGWLMLAWPVALNLYQLSLPFSTDRASYETKRFEQTVGVSFPEGARLLLAEHGFGLQDKRHLWLFESTPEQFEAHVTDRGWGLSENWPFEECGEWMPLKKAIKRFSQDSPWEPFEMYEWMADRDDASPITGPGNLITDKAHRRWLVWWHGI